MGELGALFNPGMRHELEERRSKAARREEEGNARDGDLRIDLESGVAVINVPGAEEDVDERGADQRGTGPTDDEAHTDAGSSADLEAGRHAAEAPDGERTEATPSGGAHQATAEPTDQPQVVKPRGKRGMSAAHR